MKRARDVRYQRKVGQDTVNSMKSWEIEGEAMGAGGCRRLSRKLSTFRAFRASQSVPNAVFERIDDIRFHL